MGVAMLTRSRLLESAAAYFPYAVLPGYHSGLVGYFHVLLANRLLQVVFMTTIIDSCLLCLHSLFLSLLSRHTF